MRREARRAPSPELVGEVLHAAQRRQLNEITGNSQATIQGGGMFAGFSIGK
jgi:hypothetical protein